MMRAVDVLYSLPSIVFVIVLITTLEDLVKKALGQSFGARTGLSVSAVKVGIHRGLKALSRKVQSNP